MKTFAKCVVYFFKGVVYLIFAAIPISCNISLYQQDTSHALFLYVWGVLVCLILFLWAEEYLRNHR